MPSTTDRTVVMTHTESVLGYYSEYHESHDHDL